jgi:hypothetical protein
MSNQNEANWYTAIFKTWQVKALGPKPTAEQLATIHKLGAKPGKQALASAMALRECGVTNPQIIQACGNPQLNKMRGFITDVLLRREPVSPSPEGHTVYKLTVTPKGLQRIKSAEARAAKAEAEGNAKPEGEAKVKKVTGKAAVKAARKAKVKAAAKPAPEAEAAPEAAQAVEVAPEADTDNASAA